MCPRYCLYLLLPTLAVACSANSDGPPRYDLSGSVTYDGSPVPRGMLRLYPDFEKGGRGPVSMIPIENGSYTSPPGKGVVGGPYVVEISGFEATGPVTSPDQVISPKPLFPTYKTFVEFDKSRASYDFDVPKVSAN